MVAEIAEEKSDQELVAAALRDSSAYALVVERYHQALFRYIGRLGDLNREDIEDILQEVFLKTYLNLNDYDPALKFSSWLYRIAHNETVSFFRKQNARPKPVVTTADGETELLQLLPDDIDLAEVVDQKQLARDVQAALTHVEEKYREVLVLKYMEELTYEEISDVLQKPLGTVSTLLNRAKKLLAEELKKNQHRYEQ